MANFQDVLRDVHDPTTHTLKTNVLTGGGQTTITPLQAWPDPKTYIGLATVTSAFGKAEDAAHTTGDFGIMALAVRNDTATALAGTTLDYIPLTTDANGGLWESLATLIAGEDLTNNILKVNQAFSVTPITTNATTVVKSGAGLFYGFTVNNNGFTTAGTIKIYDNTAGSGTLLGTWTIPIEPPGTLLLATVYVPPHLGINALFATGLTIVTATTAPAPDMTVMWR